MATSPPTRHPEPTGSGEQRPTQICNIKRDIPLRAMLRADMRVLPAAERAAAAVMECEQRRIARR